MGGRCPHLIDCREPNASGLSVRNPEHEVFPSIPHYSLLIPNYYLFSSSNFFMKATSFSTPSIGIAL